MRARLSFVLLTLLGLIGCGRSGSADPKDALVVFAAASLTEAFTELARGFEAAHPEIEVHLNFAGSQVLRMQIEQGAPADLFASADLHHMRALVEGGHAHPPQTFAFNTLVLLIPANNPAKIEDFSDLPRAQRLVIGAETVPVGAYTRQMLERARGPYGAPFVEGVQRAVVSEESHVRLVRAKVELGEADAAIVYRTDAQTSKNTRVVPIPETINPRASYPIAVLTRRPHPARARAFLDHILAPAGQQILASHGFLLEER